MLVRSIAAIALLSLAAHAHAAAKTLVVRCDGCSTTDKRATALAQPVTTNANVYILDLRLAGPVMTGFYVYRASQPNIVSDPGSKAVEAPTQKSGGTLWSEPLSITPSQKAAFEDYADAYLDLLAAKGAGDLVLPDDDGNGSIDDIVNCLACATSWLQANHAAFAEQLNVFDVFVAQGAVLGATINGTVTVGYDPNLTYRVRMQGDVGKNVGYCMATLGVNGLQVDTTKCFDSDGNPIPTSAAGYAGNVFRFWTNQDFIEWQTRAHQYGISFGIPVGTVEVLPLRMDCDPMPCKEDKQ